MAASKKEEISKKDAQKTVGNQTKQTGPALKAPAKCTILELNIKNLNSSYHILL